METNHRAVRDTEVNLQALNRKDMEVAKVALQVLMAVLAAEELEHLMEAVIAVVPRV